MDAALPWVAAEMRSLPQRTHVPLAISSPKACFLGAAPLLLWATLAGGCGGVGPSSSGSHHALDEVRLMAVQSPVGYRFERVRPRTLFFEALSLVHAGEDEEAVRLFDRLVDLFPSSDYMPPALYDAALLMERLGRDAQAASRLERLVRMVPDSRDLISTRLRLAQVNVRLERWDRAEAELAAVLRTPDLPGAVRVEALTDRARLLLASGRLAEAADAAVGTLAYGAGLLPEARSAGRIASCLAEASFLHAESYRRRAAAVPLAGLGRRLAASHLALRGRLMLEAQRLYFETLRRGEPRWAERAGRRLGALYRDLWNELPGDTTLDAAQGAARAADELAALAVQVHELVRRGLRDADLALGQVEHLDAAERATRRVRAEIEQARAQLEGPGGSPSDAALLPQDL